MVLVELLLEQLSTKLLENNLLINKKYNDSMMDNIVYNCIGHSMITLLNN